MSAGLPKFSADIRRSRDWRIYTRKVESSNVCIRPIAEIR